MRVHASAWSAVAFVLLASGLAHGQGVIQVQLGPADALVHGELPVAAFPGLDADLDGYADLGEVLKSRRALAAMTRSRLFLLDHRGKVGEARLVSVDLPVGVTRATSLQMLMDVGWDGRAESVTLQYRLFPPQRPQPVSWRAHDGKAVRSGHLDPPEGRAVLRARPKPRRHRPLPEHARPPTGPDEGGLEVEDLVLAVVAVLVALAGLLWRRRQR